MGVQAGAVATKGVLGDACAAGHRERSGMEHGPGKVRMGTRRGTLSFIELPVDTGRGGYMICVPINIGCCCMCAWRACMHTVLRCSAAACLLVPIFADHVGGLHVAMLFEGCVQAFPSGHVGPLATAWNKRWEIREGTAKRGGRSTGRSSSQEVEVCRLQMWKVCAV